MDDFKLAALHQRHVRAQCASLYPDHVSYFHSVRNVGRAANLDGSDKLLVNSLSGTLRECVRLGPLGFLTEDYPQITPITQIRKIATKGQVTGFVCFLELLSGLGLSILLSSGSFVICEIGVICGLSVLVKVISEPVGGGMCGQILTYLALDFLLGRAHGHVDEMVR